LLNLFDTLFEDFDVIATLNLNGDYLRYTTITAITTTAATTSSSNGGGGSSSGGCSIDSAFTTTVIISRAHNLTSDALAAQVGGIGIAPGGNINYSRFAARFCLLTRAPVTVPQRPRHLRGYARHGPEIRKS
jgi:hypothetical protein